MINTCIPVQASESRALPVSLNQIGRVMSRVAPDMASTTGRKETVLEELTPVVSLAPT